MCGLVVLARDANAPDSVHQAPLTPEKMSLRARFIQADKEAAITLLVYIGYLLWWALCAYGLGSQDPETYTYIWGLPAWFFYSCVVGYPALSLALWIVILLFFKDMPLDDDNDDEADARPKAPPSLLGEETQQSPHISCALSCLHTSLADTSTLSEAPMPSPSFALKPLEEKDVPSHE